MRIAWLTENYPPGGLTIGVFGHLKAKKGLVFLLDALRRGPERESFHCLLAGELGAESAEWLERHEPELSSTPLPFLDRYDLLPLCAASDYVALPSSYDGMPNVLLEAMALRLPLIASGVGGMADLLDDGVHGYLFNPGDGHGVRRALARAAAAPPEKRERLGGACRELADGDGALQFVFEADDGAVSVRGPVEQSLLQGKESGTYKRKYSLPDGTALAISTGDAERFKLKSPDGALLWKVKRDGDRMKISDNDENADAAVLCRRGADKWKLDQDNGSLGKIKQYPDSGKIKVKDYGDVTRHEIIDGPFTPAPLVLLLDRIPRDQAYAVLTEIWLRGW